MDEYEDHLLESTIELIRDRQKHTQGNGHQFSEFSRELIEQLSALFIKNRRQNTANNSRAMPCLHAKPLSEAFEEFITEKRLGWKQINGSEGQYIDEVFPLFIEVNGNLKTSEITKTHVTEFAKVVL